MTDIFELIGRVSIEGVDKAERELNGLSDTGEKSSSKLSKLGGVVSTIGKGLLIGTGAVATAGVGLVKQVSASYGELQQSIGGVETLFGESAQKVIDNANNAFTTAGISANDYMQQVTSFSASLLQSLGGDTEKACNYADTAVRDMADNANKMGTSMEDIQHAYQGFAKGNYTMLDNLKLGYGGTATEMARLINDSGVLGDKMIDLSDKQNIGNALAEVGYAKQIEAIHKIQEEMGITGTTALEAGGTIEGSFNSLSASWENFVAGLGNPDADMKVLVENLAKGISGAISNVTPVIDNMVKVLPTVVKAITGSIKDMLPTVITTFTELITEVINAIVELLPTAIPLILDCVLSVAEAIIQNLPQIIDAFLLLISELISKVSEMLPTLIPLVIDVIIQIAQSLIDNAPLILNALMDLLNNLVTALIDAVPTIIEALPTLIDGVLNFLLESIPVILDGAIQLFMAIIDALPTIITELVNALPNIINTITNFLTSALPQLIDASITLLMALVEALPTIIDALVKALPTIIDSLVNFLIENIPVLLEASIRFFMAFTTAMFEMRVELLKAVPKVIKVFVTALGKEVPKVVKAIVLGVSELPTKLFNVANNTYEKVTGKFKNIAVWFKNKFQEALNFIKEVWKNPEIFFSNVWSKIKNVFSSVGNWFKKLFSQAWKNIKTAFSPAKTFFSGVWSDIKTVFNAVDSHFGNVFSEAYNKVKDVFNNLPSFFSGLWDRIKSTFSSLGTKLGDAIGGGVKSGINGILGMIEGAINDALNMINGALSMINKIPGVEIGKFSMVSLPRLAKGAIVDEPTLAEIGENGKEAVIPLENNTGWINGLAKNLMQEIKSMPIENVNNENPVQKYQVSFDTQFNALNDRFDRVISLIGKYLPGIADNAEKPITIDGKSLAFGISRNIDAQLGKISTAKGRGNV